MKKVKAKPCTQEISLDKVVRHLSAWKMKNPNVTIADDAGKELLDIWAPSAFSLCHNVFLAINLKLALNATKSFIKYNTFVVDKLSDEFEELNIPFLDKVIEEMVFGDLDLLSSSLPSHSGVIDAQLIKTVRKKFK